VKHSFHPEALEEYLGAVAYYANISPSLAESFINALESGIQEILTYPEAWQIVGEDVRRYLIKRFPFGVLNGIDPDKDKDAIRFLTL
jgi:plasmid stabilization system protein ParE